MAPLVAKDRGDFIFHVPDAEVENLTLCRNVVKCTSNLKMQHRIFGTDVKPSDDAEGISDFRNLRSRESGFSSALNDCFIKLYTKAKISFPFYTFLFLSVH
jgi:hypothetical protein